MFCSLLLYAVIPASVNPVNVATLSDTSQLKYSELVAGSGVGVGSWVGVGFCVGFGTGSSLSVSISSITWLFISILYEYVFLLPEVLLI